MFENAYIHYLVCLEAGASASVYSALAKSQSVSMVYSTTDITCSAQCNSCLLINWVHGARRGCRVNGINWRSATLLCVQYIHRYMHIAITLHIYVHVYVVMHELCEGTVGLHAITCTITDVALLRTNLRLHSSDSIYACCIVLIWIEMYMIVDIKDVDR